MVRHCMKVIKQPVDFLNPGQLSVIAGDQLVYALRKYVQWLCPSHYNDKVWMMSPLHIKMAFLSAIGDWLEVCGWTVLLEKAKINTPRRVEDGGKVESSCYAHQITLVALLNLSNEAFKSQSERTNYEE